MYPLEFYRSLQVDRHARLARLGSRSRRRELRLPAAATPVTVPGPSGDVVLTTDGVTRVEPYPEPARR